MRKVLLFAILIILFKVASSQVFKDSGDTTRVTIVNTNPEYLEHYSQKVLNYKNNTHIAMSKVSNDRVIFIKMDDNSNVESAQYVTIDSFNVKDFDIFENKLYFCGSKNNNVSTEAFIAYVPLEDLFPTQISIPLTPSTIKYTLINGMYQDSVFSIDRMEVFRDSNNVVIAGLGKMYYGKPPYQTLSPSPGGTTMVVNDFDEYYLDFFMFYTIKENTIVTNQNAVNMGSAPIYASVNDFEMFYVPTDTVASCYYNKFSDITETDNKIYLLSVDYSIITDSVYFTTAYFNLYSFDKFTRQQQSANINLPFSIYQGYGIKTVHLTDDNFAVALNSYNYQNRIQTAHVFKISPDDTTIFNVSNISFFDSFYGRGFEIYDCEYLPREEEVIVLKKSVINNHKTDVVFHLDMRPNVSYPYSSHKYKVNLKEGSNYDIYFNDLYVCGMKDYAAIGSFTESRMVVYDTKNNSYLSNSPCFEEESFSVTNVSQYNVIPIPALEQCEFSEQTLSVVDNHLFTFYSSVPIHYVIINNKPLPNPHQSSIEIECLK